MSGVPRRSEAVYATTAPLLSVAVRVLTRLRVVGLEHLPVVPIGTAGLERHRPRRLLRRPATAVISAPVRVPQQHRAGPDRRSWYAQVSDRLLGRVRELADVADELVTAMRGAAGGPGGGRP